MPELTSGKGNRSYWLLMDKPFIIDNEGAESVHIVLISCSFKVARPPMPTLGSGDPLWFGDGDDEFCSLFLMVEFQKFFISLSVRPGKRAAI